MSTTHHRLDAGGATRAPRGSTPCPESVGGVLDPHLIVTFAALAVTHTGRDSHCGLAVVPHGRAPETLAATDDLPVRADWLQHELGDGPAMTAHTQEILISKDLADDERWPDFGRLCVAALDLRCMISIPIELPGDDRALLSFYGRGPCDLDHLDVDAALRLARLAPPGISQVLYRHGPELAGASEGDFSRVAIALGTVIARHDLDPTKAFDLLRQASRALDRELLDVAIDILRSDALPPELVRLLGPRRLTTGSADTVPVGGPELWRNRRRH